MTNNFLVFPVCQRTPYGSVWKDSLGLNLDLCGSWSSHVREFVENNHITGLCLLPMYGWAGKDLNFLSDIPFLKSLKLIGVSVREVEALKSLTNLRHLSVVSSRTGRLHLQGLKKLESLHLDWVKGAESLFELDQLRSLDLNRLPSAYVERLSQLERLEVLHVSLCRSNVIPRLRCGNRLRSLDIQFFNHLDDISFLETLVNLTRLSLSGSKLVNNISVCGRLTKLETLVLSDLGQIDSIEPLKSLQNLRALYLGGTTNIVDGRVSLLKDFKKLRNVQFKNRKHYDAKQEEFPTESSGILRDEIEYSTD